MELVCLVTIDKIEDAQVIANKLLEAKLAACVNIIRGMTSMYWWEEKIQTDTECLLIIKTTQSCVTGLIDKVKKLHSYSVPEIIALPVKQGNEDYLKWIRDNVEKA